MTSAAASLQMVVPHRQSGDQHHNVDLTSSGFSVQQHYSKRVDSRTETCTQQTASRRQDGQELATQPLGQWKLDHRIQSDPANPCHWSCSVSSQQDTALIFQVGESHSHCPSPNYQTGWGQHLQSDHCPMSLPERDSDRTTDVMPSGDVPRATTCLLKHPEDNNQTTHFDSTSDSSSHSRNDDEEILGFHNQRSVETQGTQTAHVGEFEDASVDGLAQRLQTVEARLTLMETRVSMLEKRDNEMI